jgi:hypothetical protein
MRSRNHQNNHQEAQAGATGKDQRVQQHPTSQRPKVPEQPPIRGEERNTRKQIHLTRRQINRCSSPKDLES